MPYAQTFKDKKILPSLQDDSSTPFLSTHLLTNEAAISELPSASFFPSEAWCTVYYIQIIFHSPANKTNFHMKGCAPGLGLKKRRR